MDVADKFSNAATATHRGAVCRKTGNLAPAAAEKAQALRNGMTQAEAQVADDNAVKWLRELEAVQTAARDAAAQAMEQRLATFRAARR